MKTLSSRLRYKAKGVLRVYGGVEGLSKNPPWLINIVLRTWFTEAERREIMEFILGWMEKQTRLLALRDLKVR